MKNPYTLCVIIAALQVLIVYLAHLILRERRQVAELKLALKVSQQFGGINPAKVAAYNQITPDQIKAAPAADLYYIQNKGFYGNSLRWWRRNKSGYCSDLAHAGKYSKAEAEDICRVRKGEDFMWSVAEIDALAERHITRVPGGIMPWIKGPR